MKQILAALVLLLLTTEAQANQLFERYIQWIVNNSELEYNGEPLPGVQTVPQDQLKIIAYGEAVVEDAQARGAELTNVIAMYNHNEDVMIVPDSMDLNDWNNHHIIVHELVHYLQDINGYYELPKYVACQTGLEELAYDLHVQWMDEVGHPGERPNALFIHMLLANCHGVHF